MLKKNLNLIQKDQKQMVNLPYVQLSTNFFFKIELITKFWLYFFGVYNDFCLDLFFIKKTRFLFYNIGDKETSLELYIKKIFSQEDELRPKFSQKERKTLFYSNLFKKYLSLSKFHFSWNLYFFWSEYLNVCNYLKKKDFIFSFRKLSVLENKYIQKGNKFKKVGICLKAFLKKIEDFDVISNNSVKSCLLILRFKRKNLFLTLLNNDGNVLCKTNIGSCGFKKKVKFTGFAIKRTSKRFSKKILGAFVRTVYSVRKNCKKHMRKIHSLKFLRQKLNVLYFNKLLKYKNLLIKKKLKITKSKSFFNWWFNNLQNKEILQKNLKKLFILKKFGNYRTYPYHRKSIRKAFKINMRVKSNLKFWGFRFVMYGLGRRFRWFNSLELRMPTPHSNGLRLKKKRRI